MKCCDGKCDEEKTEVKEGVFKGILSGILSSLCCIGPLVLLFMGIGSVSLALYIGHYEVIFLLIGLLSAFLSIYIHLKNKSRVYGKNLLTLNGLKQEKTFIFSLFVSMFVVYALLLYVAVPFFAPSVYGSASGSSTPSVQTSAPNPEPVQSPSSNGFRKLKVYIQGMTCTGCAYGIESILNEKKGVVSAKVDFNSQTGEIVYNPLLITKEEIINSDAFSYYPAKEIYDVPYSSG